MLGPNWDGPFRVTTSLDNRAYILHELDGKEIPRTWNATQLKFYFNRLDVKLDVALFFPLKYSFPKKEKSWFWL